ncbi:hypothetical protein [Pseudomonas antarctica]|uniref:hypothetical protein n=1 Tax=Pseudomonas antarctica TaxID=219572 RepID=UPI00387B8E71
MFYETEKAACEAGKARVGLSTLGGDNRVTIEANGLIGFKAAFLSEAERQKLTEFSKNDAMAMKALQSK